jgi:hypothetical protein
MLQSSLSLSFILLCNINIVPAFFSYLNSSHARISKLPIYLDAQSHIADEDWKHPRTERQLSDGTMHLLFSQQQHLQGGIATDQLGAWDRSTL